MKVFTCKKKKKKRKSFQDFRWISGLRTWAVFGRMRENLIKYHLEKRKIVVLERGELGGGWGWLLSL